MAVVLHTQCESAARSESARCEGRIAELEAECAALRAALGREAAARRELEADAKAAFMRSVCALNLEAAGLRPSAAGTAAGAVALLGGPRR